MAHVHLRVGRRPRGPVRAVAAVAREQPWRKVPVRERKRKHLDGRLNEIRLVVSVWCIHIEGTGYEYVLKVTLGLLIR